MKRSLLKLTFLLTFVILIGCGPAKIDRYVEIKPNETAFVIPIEGSTGLQKQFMSIEYLEQRKVAAKRIYLSQTTVSTGRFWFEYKWVPTVKVIVVDRTPITLTWEGTDGIHVESKDSIGFIIGINVSAYVQEKDAAKFLYYFPSGNLAKILNNIVKSKATEILSREFAKYDLETGRGKKGEIVDLAKNELIKYFNDYGVTITTFGLTGGLQYEDKEIQEAINENFKSELRIRDEQNKRIAQEQINQRIISEAQAKRKAAEEFAKAQKAQIAMIELEIAKLKAQAELEKAKKWDGKLPANIMPSGAGFILNK